MHARLHLAVFRVAELEKHAFVRRIPGRLDLRVYMGVSLCYLLVDLEAHIPLVCMDGWMGGMYVMYACM